MDRNKSTYKNLQQKKLFFRKKSYDIDASFDNVLNTLLPRTQKNRIAEDKKNKSSDYRKAIQELDARLSDSEKRRLEAEKDYSSKLSSLNRAIEEGDKNNLELSKDLKAAIEKVYKQRQNKDAQEAPENTVANNSASEDALESEDTVENNDEGSELGTIMNPNISTNPTSANKEDTKENVVTKAITKNLNLEDRIDIGDYQYKVTNLFGPRTGDNSVPGREGEHSGGVDLVGYDKNSGLKNVPIAVTDGVILDIRKQGTTKPIHPTKGRSAGVYMRVKMPDGKIMTYMHLGEDAWKNRKSLLNKKISRGDLLYEGDYSKGSGSQTAPHIKVKVSSMNEDYTLNNDHTDPKNNPNTYILYGKYVE